MVARAPARCGTPSGYRRHQRLGEKPCEDCAKAKRDYDAARRRLVPAVEVKSRIRAQAQVNAYRTLAYRYPEQYRQQYQLEVARLCAEHGVNPLFHPLDVMPE